jgi:diguanylate cyclase (GGDEF)-like protein
MAKPRVGSAPSLPPTYAPANTIPVPSTPSSSQTQTPVPQTARVEPVTQVFDCLPNLYPEGAEGTSTDQTAVIAPMSLRSVARATLMVLAGSAAGKVYPIDSSRFVIGRGRDASLVLNDMGISRKHCTIVRDDSGRYTILDEGSTNGTLVNGVRADRVELRTGDRFQIGAECVLQFGFFDAAEEDLVNKLYDSATRDPLTRALNRRAFQERLVVEVSYAIRHREPLVGILLDIDHFKSVNDTYGHPAGDEVLRGVASVISTTLRVEDVFARYGGEEFVLLGRGLVLADGVKLAERIRLLVFGTEFLIPKGRLRVTISAGVAELGEAASDTTGEAMLAIADKRLYAAKSGGRNRVVSTSQVTSPPRP